MEILDMPEPAAGEKNVQVSTLLEKEGCRILRVFIRKGAVLRRHTSPVPVSVVVVSGDGTMEVGQDRTELKPVRIVSFGAWVPHEVRAESDLTLLVFKYPAAG